MMQKVLLRKLVFLFFSSVNFVLDFFWLWWGFELKKKALLNTTVLSYDEKEGGAYKLTLRVKGVGFGFSFRFLGFWV